MWARKAQVFMAERMQLVWFYKHRNNSVRFTIVAWSDLFAVLDMGLWRRWFYMIGGRSRHRVCVCCSKTG